ncbi:phenylalanine--tRNA ligase subunit alpha [soil metagenome]
MADEVTTDLRSRLDSARAEGLAKIQAATNLDSLEEARTLALGRKAPLALARAQLRDAPAEDRADLGRLANDVYGDLERAVAAKRKAFEATEQAFRWESERIDVTLPGDELSVGSIHPLTRTVWELVDIFVGLGFRFAEGPEVELARYNFDALNTPEEHPARYETDTYYVAGREGEVCLRTQTSPVQIRAMEHQEPPVYVVCPGRTYRREAQDATHLSSFTQIEGLAVDEGITMADLKGTLLAFARELFGRDLAIRLRPHFFPFTEPSAELDVECFKCRGEGCRMCKREGWIEILGCGMVHPFLLEWVGYDPERYTGFAFGGGVERIAALAHGVNDIRRFWENDVRFLGQFGGLA